MSGTTTPKSKLKSGTMQFRGASRDNFEVASFIEYDKYGFSPVVLLSLFKEFKRDEAHTIHMQLDVYTLRQFIQGITTVKADAPDNFSTKTGGTDTTKTLFVGITEKGVIFINMVQGEKKLKMAFDRFHIAAMARSLTAMAETLEAKAIELELEKSMKAVRAPFEKKREAEAKERDKRMLEILESIVLKQVG